VFATHWRDTRVIDVELSLAPLANYPDSIKANRFPIPVFVAESHYERNV